MKKRRAEQPSTKERWHNAVLERYLRAMCSAAAKDGAMALRTAAAQRKLRAEKKEHARLLREIGKKRAACELGQGRARDVEQEVARGLSALQQAWTETLREARTLVHALLDETSPLDKRQRTRLRRHCAAVLPASVWQRSESLPQDQGSSRSPASRPAPGRPLGSPSEAGPSAPKPTGDHTTLLRAAFRRLVLGLHPDTAPNEAERERRTSLMKEVTRAYEAEDLARLVELEHKCLAGSAQLGEQQSGAELAALIEQNRVLRRQLRKLTAEWKAVRDRALGAPDTQQNAVSSQQHVRQLLAPFEHELAWLQQFRDQARLLANGELEVAELIAATQPMGNEA